jgi:hypothetical protein
MWGKRKKEPHRAGRSEARSDEWGACEYLDDGDQARSDSEGDSEAGLAWRAARHGRPEDWPSRPGPPPA